MGWKSIWEELILRNVILGKSINDRRWLGIPSKNPKKVLWFFSINYRKNIKLRLVELSSVCGLIINYCSTNIFFPNKVNRVYRVYRLTIWSFFHWTLNWQKLFTAYQVEYNVLSFCHFSREPSDDKWWRQWLLCRKLPWYRWNSFSR